MDLRSAAIRTIVWATGLPVLRRRKSTSIHGAEDDACDLVSHLERYLASALTA
jgi:putative flavoprotein involved in K+ transport